MNTSSNPPVPAPKEAPPRQESRGIGRFIFTFILVIALLVGVAGFVTFGWFEVERIKVLESRMTTYFDAEAQLRGEQLIATNQQTDARMARIETLLGSVQAQINTLTLRVDRLDQATRLRNQNIDSTLAQLTERVDTISPEGVEERRLQQRLELQRIRSAVDLSQNPLFLQGDGDGTKRQLQIAASLTQGSTLPPGHVDAILKAITRDLDQLQTARSSLYSHRVELLKTLESEFADITDSFRLQLTPPQPREIALNDGLWESLISLLERVFIFRRITPITEVNIGNIDLGLLSSNFNASIGLAHNALATANTLAWRLAISELEQLTSQIPALRESDTLQKILEVEELQPLPSPENTSNLLLRLTAETDYSK